MTIVPVPLDRHPAVTVDQLTEDAAALAADSVARSTEEAYARDWRTWCAFCADEGVEPLPGDSLEVVRFIASLVNRGARPATIERRLAGIAYGHRRAGFPTPTRHPQVGLVLSGARRRLGVAQRRAAALGPAEMRLLLAALVPTTMAGLRDRALLLTGWFGGLRRSELVGLDLADLEERAGGLAVTIRRSKTDQAGHGRMVWLPRQSDPDGCPVAALRAWVAELAAQGFLWGPVFRGLGRTGVRILAGRLTGKSCERIIGRAVAAAALEGGPWSMHSLRAGFVTAAAEAGSSLPEIAAQTGHSPGGRTLEKYLRHADPARGNAAGRLSLAAENHSNDR